MFSCFTQPVDVNVPTHLAIIPGPVWLKNTERLDLLIQWCLGKGIEELSFFAWPVAFWDTHDIQLLETYIGQLQCKNVSFRLVASSEFRLSTEMRLNCSKLHDSEAKLEVYLYVSYSFEEDLESVQYGNQFKQLSKVPSSASDPDLLVCTGGLYNLSGFCMARLTKTTLLFSSVSFDVCDNEVWDDSIETYTTIKTLKP